MIPNWTEYQHYKRRDPVWLRDYVRQLWNPQWADQSLMRRGLLWTARLAYAHHNGRLRIRDLHQYLSDDDQSVTRRLPVMAERLSDAGLLGLVASEPLSLKTLSNTRVREAWPGAAAANGRMPPCPLCEVGGGFHAADCPSLALPLDPT